MYLFAHFKVYDLTSFVLLSDLEGPHFLFDFDLFSYPHFHYKLSLLGMLTQPSTFSPDCFFNVCEKPSKFAVGVSVVNDYTLTPCPRSQPLSRHRVCVVNN